MIQHFHFKPLFEHAQLPGWAISFFYKQQRYNAEYLKDGTMKWLSESPEPIEEIEKIVHELMLFHVYN